MTSTRSKTVPPLATSKMVLRSFLRFVFICLFLICQTTHFPSRLHDQTNFKYFSPILMKRIEIARIVSVCCLVIHPIFSFLSSRQLEDTIRNKLRVKGFSISYDGFFDLFDLSKEILSESKFSITYQHRRPKFPDRIQKPGQCPHQEILKAQTS